MKRRFGETILVLAGLVFGAAVGAETGSEKIHLARPEDVPEWARQGNFRFIRIDGGLIESRKAERTWWGQNFTDEEKRVLSHIYDEQWVQMQDLLKLADFNWIWVTWSNGWSLQTEAANREALKRVIEQCHEHGIHVTAYLSGANLFWWDTFRREPETRKWLLHTLGFLPVLYGASPHRLLADVSKPEWRSYLLQKAELAIDAGADAIFYDNIFGDNYSNKLLLSETQGLAERKTRESGRPKALVYANVHMAPARFELNDSCDLYWDEGGKDTPGVWEDGWQAGNVRKIKFIYGEKQPWQTVMFENDVYHCGPRESCIPSPLEQELGIAEAYAFGAALSRNIEGRFLKGLILGEKPAKDAWQAIGQYNRFVDEHSALYSKLSQVARVALLSESEKNPLADVFIRRNVMFGSKVLQHLDKGTPLAQYQVLVIPFAIRELNPDQEKILAGFAASGGKIFAVRQRAKIFQEMSGSIMPISEAQKIMLESGEPVKKLVEQIQDAAGGPVIAMENSSYVLANVTRKNDAEIFIVHLINYDHKNPARNLRVRLNLNGLVENLSGFQVRLISPDQNSSPAAELPIRGASCEFSVPIVEHYAVAIISR